TSVTIGNSVTTICCGAFSDCSGLTSVTTPNSVTTIGSSAFYGCSGLTSVTIPNSVTTIDDYAFRSCSGLTSITIPNSVTKIGEWAFEGCSALESVISSATTAPIAYEGTFSNTTYTNATLYIPVESLPSYNSATCWKNFQIVEDDDITKVEGVRTGNTPVEIARYSLAGKKLLAPEKGINIIKMSDGTTRKVIVR
ncbi:MAG: leucine-rich repeat domain-containing protein, partial [Bacteroidaceae bacterium]|nr:leucine-rich repeat domain-containing protein [Bacteroidaceae bacterium]